MTEALVVSNSILWVLVLALMIGVIALARQIGILYERIAPMGALILDKGPKMGEPSPRFVLQSMDRTMVNLGAAGPTSTLLFFLSPTCPVCKKLLPIIKSIRQAEGRWLDVVLASDGDFPEHHAFWQKAGLNSFPYVLSAELGMRFQVSKLPYAVLLDERGIIRSKGLVNSREQLESLFAAKELGVGSVQEFIGNEVRRSSLREEIQ